MPTRSPTPPSTRRPTKAPTTTSPSLFPAPTTRYPTPPTTQYPTSSPLTSTPSSSPTSSPSHSPTLPSPTQSPATSLPSLAPTTSQPSTSPSRSPTRSPVLPTYCSNLTSNATQVYGQVCTRFATSTGLFELAFVFPQGGGANVQSTQVWMGMDPTTIPTSPTGVPQYVQFPHQNQSASVLSVRVQTFTTNCRVFVLAQAVVDDGVVLGSGSVEFNSQARMFIHPIECPVPTLAPTQQPTPNPTDVFNVRFQFPGLPPRQGLMESLTTAVSRLQSLLPLDYASAMCFEAGSSQCLQLFPDRLCFDDLMLVVNVTAGSANATKVWPCVLNAQTEQVRASYLEVGDSTRPYDEDEVFTWMLQSLGFGNRWADWGLVPSSSGAEYRGRFALEQFTKLGGLSDGLLTTNQAQFWSPSSVGEQELMTPWTSSKPKLLSPMTIAALLDLNLPKVDLTKASPGYALPSGRRLQSATSAPTPSPGGAPGAVTLPSQVKPNREADYNAEVSFALANFPGLATPRPTTAPTAEPTQVPTTSPVVPPQGLDGGAIAGIVIGILVGVCLLCLCLYCLVCRRRDRANNNQQQQPKPKKDALESKWVEKTDGERTYWINEETGEFSWAPPVGVGISTAASAAADTAAKLPPPSVAAAASKRNRTSQPQGEWTEMTDESNNPFWVNDETGEFSWVPPPANGRPANKPVVVAKPPAAAAAATITTTSLAVRQDPEVDYDKYVSRADHGAYAVDDPEEELLLLHRPPLPAAGAAATRRTRTESTPDAPPPPVPSQRRSSLEDLQGAPLFVGKSRYMDESDEEEEFRPALPAPQIKMGEHQGQTVWKEDFDML